MGGADRVFAGAHSKGCCYARTYHHEMMPEGKGKFQHAEARVFPLAAISPEDYFFLADGLDEEDVDETFGRKFKMTGRYYALLFLESALHEPDHFFKTTPSLSHQDSDKYIFQRVFRV